LAKIGKDVENQKLINSVSYNNLRRLGNSGILTSNPAGRTNNIKGLRFYRRAPYLFCSNIAALNFCAIPNKI